MTVTGKYSGMPRQRIPRSQKTEDWALGCAKWIDAFSADSGLQRQNDWINYDLYSGVIDRTDFAHITNPYGGEFELPSDFQHYDIVTQKIKLLLGEELKRPFNFTASLSNPEAVREKQNALTNMLTTAVLESLSGGEEVQEGQFSHITKYFTYSYQDLREKISNSLLKYIVKEEGVREKFNRGWEHALIAGREIYHVDIRHGQVKVDPINPVYFVYDISHETQKIEDAHWARYESYLTPSEIIERYYDILTDEEIKRLDSDGVYYKTNLTNPFGTTEIRVERTSMPIHFGKDNSINYMRHRVGIRHVHYVWKSLAKVGILTYLDDDGEEQKTIVNENFKMPPGVPNMSIRWFWVNEVWEAVRIGGDDDMFIKARPLPYQRRSINNLSYVPLPYVGMIYERLNSISTSLMDRMKPYQYEYDITMYRIGLEIAKSRGKQVVIDVAQIPSGGAYGWSMDKWLYYKEVLGVIFINSAAKTENGQPVNFNQFKDIDQSISSSVSQLFEYLMLLEQRVAQVSGVTQQREGNIGNTEAVTNAQRAVVQSSHITEQYFYKHNLVKQAVLNAVLDCAKVAFRGNSVLQYITDELGSVVLDLENVDLLSADYAVFVTDSGKELEALDFAKNTVQLALQSGTISFADSLELLSLESPVEIKHRMRALEQARQQQIAQQQQAQAEAEQMKAQMDMQMKQQELEIKKLELQVLVENNIRDNQTQLAKQQLANSKQTGTTEAPDEEANEREERKLDLQETQIEENIRLAKQKLELDRQKLKADIAIKQQKLELDAKKIAVAKQKSSSSK
jgi:hypothetical protein